MLDYGQQLEKLSEKHVELAGEYASLMEENGVAEATVTKEVARRLSAYQSKNARIGFETATVARLGEAIRDKEDDFVSAYDQMAIGGKKAKGMEKYLESLKLGQIDIQSVMKHNVQGEYNA